MSLPSWGFYPKSNGKHAAFRSKQDLSELRKRSQYSIAYGNGRSYGDSALADNQLHTISNNYFKRFNHRNGQLTVEAGTLLEDILRTFVPRGWFLKVTPGTRLITIGGAIASDVHGKNHHNQGCFSSSVTSIKILLASGKIETCSHTKNSELFRATCGGQGLTGVILSATIQLKPIKSSTVNVLNIKTKNLKDTFNIFKEYQHYTYSVAWIDCMAQGDQLGRSIISFGEFAEDGNLSYQPKNLMTLPCFFPSFLLNRFTVQLFNIFYYHRIRKRESNTTQGIDSFFYPLDSIQSWNKLYGQKGFVQYQFILPLDKSYEGMTLLLNTIAESGLGSFLAVLKLYGESNDNFLSFPMEGYSLALDFKITKKLWPLLDELDEIVSNYGGRVYLAKDARIKKDAFERNYPDIDKFRAFRKEIGADKVFASYQSKRLDL